MGVYFSIVIRLLFENMVSEMKGYYMDSLKQQFPQLVFAKDADKWLQSYKRKELLEQLESRRITEVKTESLLSSGGMKIGEDGNFIVLLNDLETPEENAESLGHEMGHTFHQDITKNPPIDSLIPDLAELTEDFCRAFSKLWLNENDKRKIVIYCQKLPRSI